MQGRLFIDFVEVRLVDGVLRERMLVTPEVLARDLLVSPVMFKSDNIEEPWRTVHPETMLTMGDEILIGLKRFLATELHANLPLSSGSLICFPKNKPGLSTCVLMLQLSRQGRTKTCSEQSLFFASDIKRWLDGKSTCAFRSMSFNVPGSSILVDTFPRCPATGFDKLKSFTKQARSDIVLVGSRGSGKTFAALALSAYNRLAFGFATVYMDCRKLRDSRTISAKDILSNLSALFEDAVAASPCTIVLDDLHELVPANDIDNFSGESSQAFQIHPMILGQSRLLGIALTRLIESVRSRADVCLVISCQDETSVIGCVRQKVEVYPLPFTLPDFSKDECDSMFSSLLKELCGHDTTDRLGSRTEGFRPVDISHLVVRVANKLRSQTGSMTAAQLVEAELDQYVPVHQASAVVDVPSTSWSDVGGLFQAKKDLVATVVRPSLYRRVYESSQIQLPRGLLLFGPSGYGKSYVVAALARKAGCRLVTCKGPQILDKYIGASEANVRDLFRRAAAVAPSILFIDELDAIAPRRGSDHTGVTDRVVNQLLTFLDGVEDNTQHVFIVGATSRPDKVDPALLRPGRLEKHVFLGASETIEEASDLLAKVARKFSLDDIAMRSIQSGSFLQKLTSEKSFNLLMSAADMNNAFRQAQIHAAHLALGSNRSAGCRITEQQLSAALYTTKPSVSTTEYNQLVSGYSKFIRKGNKGCNASSPELPDSDELLTALR